MIKIGMENLSNGIICQAAKDYRKALSTQDDFEISNIEKFFRSIWYQHLTNLDGEFLIEEIRKEFE